MIVRPIPADVLANYGNLVTRDVTEPDYGLLFGFHAVAADLAVRYAPEHITRAVLEGSIDQARYEARRYALARDALPTEAEARAARVR